MSQGLISVVIPCFNHGQFLAGAIEGALSQDYPCVEVVVVDDGSTDETATVAARYAGLRYLYQKNSGLAAARNAGLRASHGDYLIFLDADDQLLPGALRAGMECMTAHPECGFAYGRFQYVDKAGTVLQDFDEPPQNKDTYLGLFGGNHIAMCATVIYRRDVLETASGFREELPAAEDYDLYFRLARAYSFTRHNAVVAQCRRHGRNMSLDAALMLRCTVRVVCSQKRYADSEPLETAYRNSLRIWRDYYGHLLVHQIHHEIRRRDLKRAAANTLTLLRFAPRVCIRAGILAAPRTMKNSIVRFPQGMRPLLRRFTWRFTRLVMPAASRRLTPLSRDFGYDRGVPIDRYYIERFLESNSSDIQGRVLEVKDNAYALRFGGARITTAEVLDVDATNENATIVADLAAGHDLPSDAFDCIILTQTLHLIYDIQTVVRTVYRLLKPGGVLLATVPCISQIARDQLGRWADYWRMTGHCARRMFGAVFGDQNVRVEAFGNMRSAIAFLEGRSVAESTDSELDFKDSDYELLITIRAVKAGSLELRAG